MTEQSRLQTIIAFYFIFDLLATAINGSVIKIAIKVNIPFFGNVLNPSGFLFFAGALFGFVIVAIAILAVGNATYPTGVQPISSTMFLVLIQIITYGTSIAYSTAVAAIFLVQTPDAIGLILPAFTGFVTLQSLVSMVNVASS